MDEFDATGRVIQHAPKNSLPAPVPTPDQWWTLMEVDGTRIISSSHLLEFLASKPDDYVVQARFNHKYDQRVVYHPLTCRSLDVFFDMARAIVPGWTDGGDLKLSPVARPRGGRTTGLRIHYREANGPFYRYGGARWAALRIARGAARKQTARRLHHRPSSKRCTENREAVTTQAPRA